MSLKTDLHCPHCHGQKFWQIMPVRTPTNYQLPVTVHGTPLRGFASEGYFEAIICAGCRYTEWYAQGIEDLKPDPERGVHFIDNEPQAGLR